MAASSPAVARRASCAVRALDPARPGRRRGARSSSRSCPLVFAGLADQLADGTQHRRRRRRRPDAGRGDQAPAAQVGRSSHTSPSPSRPGRGVPDRARDARRRRSTGPRPCGEASRPGRRLRDRPRLPPARAAALPAATSRRRSMPTNAAVDYELGLLAQRARPRRIATRSSCAAGCTSRSPRVRPGARSTGRRRARRSSPRSRRSRGGAVAAARPRSTQPHVTVASLAGDAAPRDPHRLGAGDARRRPDPAAAPALAHRDDARPDDAALLGPGRRPLLRAPRERSSTARRRTRPSPSRATAGARRPGRSPASSSTSRVAPPASLAAAKRAPNRVTARSSLARRHPPALDRSGARRWGSPATVGTYETIYGGDPNRIHNVQLVAHLVDGKLIAPGATFSFNGTTGERTAAKGFLEAPVIVNGELQTGLGGGVCQVSTTVFNAAYEAGLPITARTNHALYISHYPLGRDATVDYPDIDLKFVNDTGHWLLLRTFVGSSSLTVDAVRDAAAPPGRVDRRSRSRSSRRRRCRRRSTRRSSRARSSSTTPAFPRSRRRSSARSTRPTGSSSPTRRGTRATARSRRSCASGRRSRRAKPTRHDHDDDTTTVTTPASLPALRIASRSQSGTRVGRQRRRVDGRVRRPAVGDRARRRARSRTRSGSARPCTSRQRAWTSSRSSNRAGWR